MTASQPLDVLVIGQGLAGSLLARELVLQGQEVLVIDDGDPASTSRVAAGLINPLAGQRLFLIHHADERLNAAERCYLSIEEEASLALLHSLPLKRLFISEKQVGDWQNRQNDPDYAPYIGERFESLAADGIEAPLGGFDQARTGWLDTVPLLDYLRDWLMQRDSYIKDRLDYNDIRIETDHVCWKDYTAKRIVFCEGHHATRNPWFNWLPFQLTKGEMLTLKTGSDLPHYIINAGKWLIPLDGHHFRMGASYDREHLDTVPTEDGKQQLLDKLESLAPKLASCEVTRHKAGIRPNTRDKIPFIGSLPEYPHVSIFNGFGSRGAMMVPWYAEVFSRHLLAGEALPADADIRRHLELRDS